jgi:hypothetical protein
VGAHPEAPTKAASAADALPGAADVKVYGVLSQPHEATGGDDAVPAVSSGPSSLLDRVNAADAGAPNHFLHRRLSVDGYQIFAFEVPPHALRPELRGTFRSVATPRNPGGGAPVQILLMNDDQFNHFVKNLPVTASFSSNPSTRGEIRWALHAPVDDPKKYYLVLRNATEGQGPTLVDADFTASFE